MRREKIFAKDDNIREIRDRYPEGLHFVVGDVHGEGKTLKALMSKIEFDPKIDHIYFIGDYNFGGNPTSLLQYISQYYQADYNQPGFHLIRGNHERELMPEYYLANLPDIIVFRGEKMDYYLAHAGMVKDVFRLIQKDMTLNDDKTVLAYKLDDRCVQLDAPFRQVIWSRRGLYSQRSRWHVWPSTNELVDTNACIIHGHSPYCFFVNNYFSYGDDNIYWENQHIWFSEDLCSFNIDANIKGRFENGEGYRNLSCLCIEILEEIASQNDGTLTIEGIISYPVNGCFTAPYVSGVFAIFNGDLHRILDATPEMKMITIDENENPAIHPIGY